MSATRASNDRPPGAGGVKRGRLQQEAAATGSRVTVVLGAQWGDEGKGKVVDLLATDADVVSRCQVRRPLPIQRAPPPPPGLSTPLGALPPGDTFPAATPTHPHRPETPTPHAHPSLLRGAPHPAYPTGLTLPTPTAAVAQGQSYKYKPC